MVLIRKRSKLPGNAIAFAELCLLLNAGEYTKDQLAEKTGLVIGTVTKWMKMLERRKLIYIVGYLKGPVGQPAAIWTWGFEVENAPRPAALTQAQYTARYRDRKRGNFGLGKQS